MPRTKNVAEVAVLLLEKAYFYSVPKVKNRFRNFKPFTGTSDLLSSHILEEVVPFKNLFFSCHYHDFAESI